MKRKLALITMALACTMLVGIGCTDFSAAIDEAKEGVDEAISETEYKVEMGTKSLECSDKMNEIAEDYEAIDFDDSDWQSSVDEHCAEVHELYEEALNMEVPESMQENHEQYVDAMEHFNNAATYFEEAADASDETMLEQVEAEVEAGIEDLEEYAEGMDEEWLNDLLSNTEELQQSFPSPVS